MILKPMMTTQSKVMKRKNINIWELAADAVTSDACFVHETPARDYLSQQKKFYREFGCAMGGNETDAYLDFLLGAVSLS